MRFIKGICIILKTEEKAKIYSVENSPLWPSLGWMIEKKNPLEERVPGLREITFG